MSKNTLQKQLEKLLKEFTKLRKDFQKTKEWDLDRLKDLEERKEALMKAIEKSK